MPTGAAVNAARKRVERLMIDGCRIERTTGTTVTMGGVTVPAITVVYTGKCRVTSSGLGGSYEDIGEQARVVSHIVLQLPIAAANPAEGDRVTMTSSLFDPQLTGKQFRVVAASRASLATSVKVSMIEVTS